jgi:ribosomal protein L33
MCGLSPRILSKNACRTIIHNYLEVGNKQNITTRINWKDYCSKPDVKS